MAQGRFQALQYIPTFVGYTLKSILDYWITVRLLVNLAVRWLTTNHNSPEEAKVKLPHP